MGNNVHNRLRRLHNTRVDLVLPGAHAPEKYILGALAWTGFEDPAECRSPWSRLVSRFAGHEHQQGGEGDDEGLLPDLPYRILFEAQGGEDLLPQWVRRLLEEAVDPRVSTISVELSRSKRCLFLLAKKVALARANGSS